MARLILIAASTMLLLGAAAPARGDFFEHLREAVELSEKERSEQADRTSAPAGGNVDGATGQATGGKGSAAGEKDVPAKPASGASGRKSGGGKSGK